MPPLFMLPFIEGRAHMCILIGTSIDGLSAPPMDVLLPITLFHQVHPLPLLDTVLSLFPFQNHCRLQCLSGLLALYQNLQTFVPIVMTLAILYGTVILFHLDPQLSTSPQEQILASPILLPILANWQQPQYYNILLTRCFLVQQVLLLLSLRLMAPQNPPDNEDEGNDDKDWIIANYSPLTRQYTTLDISNFKCLNEPSPTTLANTLVAEGHVGTLKPKSTIIITFFYFIMGIFHFSK